MKAKIGPKEQLLRDQRAARVKEAVGKARAAVRAEAVPMAKRIGTKVKAKVIDKVVGVKFARRGD